MTSTEIMDRVIEIRRTCNVELEKLREAKLIGKAEEAAIEVHLEGPTKEMRRLLLESDLIRKFCKVSEVLFSQEYLDNVFKPSNVPFKCKITAKSIKNDPEYIQCPRCFFYTSIVASPPNYDGLCNRCCRVLVNGFPDHPSVPNILSTLKIQNKQVLEQLNMRQ